MQYSLYIAILWAISSHVLLIHATPCSRVPQGATAAKSPVDDNFVLSVGGNAQSYVPGQKYNVTLSAYSGLSFVSFMLALELENGEENDDANTLGAFELSDLAETRFSPRCANLVENTNTNLKTHVDVVWAAPTQPGQGCIMLRATVMQHRDVWFMDDGFLSKRMCEEEVDDVDTQPSIVDPCCACDEAKYELTFEGKWSRHTHPKDFPANSWRTRFSDIIGASHTIDYRFWQYGELASEGLREVAEHGSTRTLESELKDQSDHIRTIIKARGIAYPNVTGKTFAVFRVDSNHHLISLVSMVDPSPDWIVGVSGLELCLPNCSWVENKIHNLYPWDAGTDSGPSYMSADQPQVPPDVVRRIKTNFPNDPRSPFYDPTGTEMKPLATLHINRRRLYEKNCEAGNSERVPAECSVLTWTRWDECSAKCGSGKQYRTREYKNPTLAMRHRCNTPLREEKSCMGHKCAKDEEEVQEGAQPEVEQPMGDPECGLSDWTEWSSCTVTCGSGEMIRTRHYLNRRAKKKCQKASKARLQETKSCEASQCGGEIAAEAGAENAEAEPEEAQAEAAAEESGGGGDSAEKRSLFRNFQSYSQRREDYIPPVCGVSPWSDFSPCLGPCGGSGTRQRLRKVWNNNEVYGVTDASSDGSDPCRHIKIFEEVNCTNPACDSIVPHYCFETLIESHCRDNDVVNFWYYDHVSDQCAIYWSDRCDTNLNKFKSKEQCDEACRLPRHKQQLQSERHGGVPPQRVDCLVSDWVAHSCNASCGDGVQLKTRRVLRTPKYGGKQCPKHLVRMDRCYQRCDDMYSVSNDFGERRHSPAKLLPLEPREECRYSEWSAWTPCTASCGDNAVRQRTRTLLNTDLSSRCKDRVRVEKCVVMPCLLSSNDDGNKW